MRPIRPMTSRQSEVGAALVLALVFLVAIGLVLAALVSVAGTNLVNTSNLQGVRNVEYASDAAVEGAIQTARHTCPTVAPPAPCVPPSPSAPVTIACPALQPAQPINGQMVAVQCTWTVPPGSFGRIAEFDACQTGVPFATCQADAVVKADVTYDDLPAGCTTMSASCPYTLGAGITVWNWTVERATS